MQITKPTKAEVMRELKDYIFITFGLISYAMGWAAFLIPLSDYDRRYYGYRSHHLLCHWISYPMVVFHH